MKRIYISCFGWLIFTTCLCGQQTRLMFYNVENFFDTRDDSLTGDNEFMPDSSRSWTYDRYWRKTVRIYKVISMVDQWEMPAVVGLCEVENRGVLEDLVYETPLEKYDYRIVHRDSPDPRGIDVALIYRKEVFTPVEVSWIRIDLEGVSETREILKVEGELWDVPVIIYVNHWPSRSGGAIYSEPRRIKAAKALSESLDSLFYREPCANVFIMGDFNDEPGDHSLQLLGSSGRPGTSGCDGKIINISPGPAMQNRIGTIKHQGSWNHFDQILVSGSVRNGLSGICLPDNMAEIFAAPCLIEPDPGYSGFRPFRTYLGPVYHNGFSDHLPVSVLVEKVRDHRDNPPVSQSTGNSE